MLEIAILKSTNKSLKKTGTNTIEKSAWFSTTFLVSCLSQHTSGVWQNKALCCPPAQGNAAPSQAVVNPFLPWPLFFFYPLFCCPLPNFCCPQVFVCQPAAIANLGFLNFLKFLSISCCCRGRQQY